MIILVFVGTLAQKELGLYLAQQKYFSSWFFWVGPLPLPGGYLTLALVFVSLLSKVLFHSPYRKQNMGIMIAHWGAVLLLFGGILTAFFSQEGAMVLSEGEKSHYISDYSLRELGFFEEGKGFDLNGPRFTQKELIKDHVLTHKDLPFKIRVLEQFDNVSFQKRVSAAPESYKGFYSQFQFFPKASEKEVEQNRAAVVFEVLSEDEETKGIYGIFEHMPISQSVKSKNKKYLAQISKMKTALPFSIELIDFEKKMYPGTNRAKSYSSLVKLIEGDSEQKILIKMNQPLRHRDYTFYQASFIEGMEKETTVLAVVKNSGRVFPYLSSIIMCIGLLVHLFLKVPLLISKRRDT